MASLNDLFRLRAKFVHEGGQIAEFVQDYKLSVINGAAPNSGSLATAFNSNVMNLMIDIISSAWTAFEVGVINYNDAGDFFDLSITDTGDLAGTPLPGVVAVGFRSPRRDVGVHRGRHNLPAGSASWLASDGSLTQAGRDACYFVQQALGMEVVTAAGSEFKPIVTKKTYSGGVLVSVVERADVLGQWQVNRYFTTSKARQDYNWEVAEEPV